jgi:hypothetical protein
MQARILAFDVETNKAPWVAGNAMAVQRTYAILNANRLPVRIINIQIQAGIIILAKFSLEVVSKPQIASKDKA